MNPSTPPSGPTADDLYTRQQHQAILIEQECVQLDAEIARVERSTDARRQLLGAAHERAHQLHQQSAQLAGQRAQAEAHCKRVGDIVQTIDAKMERMLEIDRTGDADVHRQNGAVAAAEEQLAKLRATIATNVKQIDAQRDANEAQRNEIVQLRTKLAQSNAAKAVARERLNAATAQRDANALASAQHRQRLAQLQATVADGQQRQQTVGARLEATAERHREAGAELRQHEAQLAHNQSGVQALRDREDRLRCRYERLFVEPYTERELRAVRLVVAFFAANNNAEAAME